MNYQNVTKERKIALLKIRMENVSAILTELTLMAFCAMSIVGITVFTYKVLQHFIF
jgi:hypothetical protein